MKNYHFEKKYDVLKIKGNLEPNCVPIRNQPTFHVIIHISDFERHVVLMATRNLARKPFGM